MTIVEILRKFTEEKLKVLEDSAGIQIYCTNHTCSEEGGAKKSAEIMQNQMVIPRSFS